MDVPDDAVQQILRYLEHDHFAFEERSPGMFLVRSVRRPARFAHEPVLSLPRELLTAYLKDGSRQYQSFDDPFAEALSMAEIHFSEALGTVDENGVNWVIATGIRRGPDGRPEFFVDQDPPPPEPLDPNSGPYTWVAERPPWTQP